MVNFNGKYENLLENTYITSFLMYRCYSMDLRAAWLQIETELLAIFVVHNITGIYIQMINYIHVLLQALDTYFSMARAMSKVSIVPVST